MKKGLKSLVGLALVFSMTACGKNTLSTSNSSTNHQNSSVSLNSQTSTSSTSVDIGGGNHNGPYCELDAEINFGVPITYTDAEIAKFNELVEGLYYSELGLEFFSQIGIDFDITYNFTEGVAWIEESFFLPLDVNEVNNKLSKGISSLKNAILSATEDQLASILYLSFGKNGFTSEQNPMGKAMTDEWTFCGFYDLEGLEKIQKSAKILGREDIASQFEQYKDLFNQELFEYHEEENYPDVFDNDVERTIISRAISRGLIALANNLSNEELKMIVTLTFGSNDYEDFVDDIDIIETLDIDYVSLLNKLGTIISNLKISARSYDLLFDVFIDDRLFNHFLDYGSLQSIDNNEYITNFFNDIKNKISGEEIKAIFNLVGSILTSVDKDALEKVFHLVEGELDLKFISSFALKIMSKLDANDKKNIKELGSEFGFNIEDIIKRIGEFADLDMSNENNQLEFSNYIQATISAIMTALNFEEPTYYGGQFDTNLYILGSDEKPIFYSDNYEIEYETEFTNFDTSKLGRHSAYMKVIYADGVIENFKFFYTVTSDYIDFVRARYDYNNGGMFKHWGTLYFELNTEDITCSVNGLSTVYGPIQDVALEECDIIGLDTAYQHDGYFFIEYDGNYLPQQYCVYNPSQVKKEIDVSKKYFVQDSSENVEVHFYEESVYPNGRRIQEDRASFTLRGLDIDTSKLGKGSVVIDSFEEPFVYNYEVVARENCVEHYSYVSDDLSSRYFSSLEDLEIYVEYEYEYFADGVYHAAGSIFEKINNDDIILVHKYDEHYSAFFHVEGYGWDYIDVDKTNISWNVGDLTEFLGFRISRPRYLNFNELVINIDGNHATLSLIGIDNVSDYYMEEYVEDYITEELGAIFDYSVGIYYFEDTNVFLSYIINGNNIHLNFVKDAELLDELLKGWDRESIKEFLGFDLDKPENFRSADIYSDNRYLSIDIYGISEEEAQTYIESLGLIRYSYSTYGLPNINDLSIGIDQWSDRLSIDFKKIDIENDINAIENKYHLNLEGYYSEYASLITVENGNICYYGIDEENVNKFISNFYESNNVVRIEKFGEEYYALGDSNVHCYYYRQTGYDDGNTINIEIRFNYIDPLLQFVGVELIKCQSNYGMSYSMDNIYLDIYFYEVSEEEYEQYLLDLENSYLVYEDSYTVVDEEYGVTYRVECYYFEDNPNLKYYVIYDGVDVNIFVQYYDPLLEFFGIETVPCTDAEFVGYSFSNNSDYYFMDVSYYGVSEEEYYQYLLDLEGAGIIYDEDSDCWYCEDNPNITVDVYYSVWEEAIRLTYWYN